MRPELAAPGPAAGPRTLARMAGHEGEEWSWGDPDDALPWEPGTPYPHGDYPGKDVLNLASPLEVLHRLLEDDVLEVHRKSWRRLWERALLLDHKAVSKRCFARVARAGPLYRGHPPLDRWLRDRFDQSIRELLSEDVEAELQGLPVDPEDTRVELLTRTLGLEPGLVRRASIRFNGAPRRSREAFFRVALEGRTIREHGFSVDRTHDQVVADLERAVRALSAPASSDGHDLPDFPEPTW